MIIYWAFFVVEALATSFGLSDPVTPYSDTLYIVLLLLNFAVFSLLASKTNQFRSSKVFAYYLVGFGLRLAFLLWVQYFSDVYLLPNAGIDEYTFYYNAMSCIHGNAVDSYSSVVAFEAKYVGLSMLGLRSVNLLLSMQALVIFSRILNVVGVSDHAYQRTMLFACLLPSYALISVLLLRESLIILLYVISLYFFVKWWKRISPISIILAVGTGYVASLLHSGSVVLTMGEILVFVFTQRYRDHFEFRLDAKRFFGLLVVMFVMLAFVNVFGSSLGIDSINDIYEASDVRVDGGAAYNATLIPIGGIAGIILNSPFHALYFLGSPFPWQWRSFGDVFAFSMSAVFYLAVLIAAVKTMKKENGTDLLHALLVLAIIAMIVFGWGVSNAGTALRHRDKMIFVYLLMLALTTETRAQITADENV